MVNKLKSLINGENRSGTPLWKALLLEKRLPWRYYKRLNSIRLFFKKITGSKVICPICGWYGVEFKPLSDRKNAACPKCNSLERHRLIYLYLKNKISRKENLKVLHFAPQNGLGKLFERHDKINYLSVDIDDSRAMKEEDITDLSFDDNSFDVVLCIHVLEHIVDDEKVVKELYRVLKPGGFAIIQVPLSDLEVTLEDENVTTEKERKKLYGNPNHVRMYGNDYKKKLESNGFEVEKDDFVKNIDKKSMRLYGLKEEYIYCCEK